MSFHANYEIFAATQYIGLSRNNRQPQLMPQITVVKLVICKKKSIDPFLSRLRQQMSLFRIVVSR